MKSLNFSYNWNKKLDGKFFTTLRTTNKYDVGDICHVTLKGTSQGMAQCVDKKIIWYGNLDVFTCGLDTGYGVKETQAILDKMYGGTDWTQQELYLILFVKIK